MKIWSPDRVTIEMDDPFTGERITFEYTGPVVAISGTKQQVEHAAERLVDIMRDELESIADESDTEGSQCKTPTQVN